MLHRLAAIPLLLLVTVAVPGCEKKAGGPEMPPPPVDVITVQPSDVSIYSDWIGTTTGFVNAQIRPKVQGYLLRQTYKDGDLVDEGQLLFEIDPRQFQAALDQATGQLGQAQAALGKSELDVKRYRPLAAEGAVSQKELDDAVQARSANAAQVASAEASVEQARLNLQWTKVKSPVKGIAAIATAQIGDLVGPTTVLTSVSQLDPIKVTFPISEIDYLRFAKQIQEHAEGKRTNEPTLELTLANGQVYPEIGHFYVTGLAVSETMGTINVQGVFPNANNVLRPGQFAKVRVATDRRTGALVIPQRAVQDLQGIDQIAIVGPDDKIILKNVKLGPPTGSSYVVDSGLEPGERVVVEGLQKIRSGMVVKPQAVSTADPAPAAGGARPAAPAGS